MPSSFRSRSRQRTVRLLLQDPKAWLPKKIRRQRRIHDERSEVSIWKTQCKHRTAYKCSIKSFPMRIYIRWSDETFNDSGQNTPPKLPTFYCLLLLLLGGLCDPRGVSLGRMQIDGLWNALSEAINYERLLEFIRLWNFLWNFLFDKEKKNKRYQSLNWNSWTKKVTISKVRLL